MSMFERIIQSQVQIESPFSAPTRDETTRNVIYAMLAMRDSLYRGEAPFASHLLYTQMLDDTKLDERTMGIKRGLVIADNADLTAVYTDLGVSRGMEYGIAHAKEARRPVVYRRLFDATASLADMEAAILDQSPLPFEVVAAVYARIHD